MKRCPQCKETFPLEFLVCPKDGVRLDDVSAEALVGQILNEKYRLDRHIASGGMASIYAATRLEIGDTVAVKILTPDALRNPMAVARFKRESQAASRIKHPGVVSVYDFSTLNDGRTFMVMEFLRGQSLRDELTTCGRLSPDRMLHVMDSVLPAMQVAHDAGIIHRDLKPENVMSQIMPDGTEVFKVVDFGVAELREQAVGQALTKLTEAGMMVGTPYYMSPEQCRSQELDARSDIYSLGIILYEMLTGTVPFASRTLSAVIIQQVTEDPRPIRDHRAEISWALEHVVLRALSKRREDRQQSAAELGAELLHAVLAGDSGGDLQKIGEHGTFTTSGSFVLTGYPVPQPSQAMKAVNTDPLTGVYTGAFFQYHLAETLIYATKAGEEVALVTLSLVGFQSVTEQLGFVVGDSLLRRVAEWMRQQLPVTSVVGRTATDEFSIVLIPRGTDGAAELASRFTTLCETQEFTIEETGADIGLVTGTALFPKQAANPVELLENARQTLQRSEAVPEKAPAVTVRFEHLVGRASECEQLMHEYSRMQSGRTNPVFLIGGAGLGKSRLVQEFRRNLLGQDVLVLATKFYESSGLLPYRAYYESLRGILGYLLEVAEKRLPTLFGAVAQQVVQDFSEGEGVTFGTETSALAGEQEKFRIFDYLTRLYLGLTRLRPVVLLVDDLHWADALSLEYLAYLMRNTIGQRFLLVVVMREREAASRDYPLMNWLRQMNRAGSYTMMTLRPLDDAEMRQLVHQTFGEAAIPAPVVERLLGESRGNPFYLREILELLVKEGTLVFELGRWDCREITEIRLPETVVDLVEAHLRCLDSQTQDVLVQAAAIGNEFTYDVLEAVTALPEAALLSILERALKNNILQEHPSRREDRYVFAHTTFRKVLYNRLTKRRRRQLHSHIGNVMAQMYAERSPIIAAELAHHYFAADDLEHALLFMIEAGNQAWRSLAIADAARYYTRAEHIIEKLGSAPLDGDAPVMQMAVLGLHVNSEKLAEFHLNYGLLCIQQGQAEKARLELEQALGFAKQLKSEMLLGRALTAKAELSQVLGDYAAGQEVTREALDLLGRVGDTLGEIKALMVMGDFLDHYGRYSQAFEVYEKALNLARQLNDRPGEVGALWGIGRSVYQIGRFEAALQHGERALEITREIGDRLGEERALTLLGTIQLDLGNTDEALNHFEAALRVVREIGYRVSEGMLLNHIGEALRQQRRYTEALVYYQESLEIARELKDFQLLAMVSLNMGLVQQGRSQHRQALELFEHSLADVAAVSSRSHEFEAMISIGDSRFALREFAAARDAYQKAVENGQETGSKRHQWKALYGLARCSRELGDSRRALKLLRETVASIEALAAGLTSYTDRNRFLKDMHRIYNDLAEIAVELGEDI
ncbi:MAG: tetratricopeptide repeat protein [Blastocatellia bacterium]|nr:tetratricopeptide repeat protein [Blastocatellia bacterium]